MLVTRKITQHANRGTQPARKPDSLARVIVTDLLRTTAGFLLVVTVIVLAVHLLT